MKHEKILAGLGYVVRLETGELNPIAKECDRLLCLEERRIDSVMLPSHIATRWKIAKNTIERHRAATGENLFTSPQGEIFLRIKDNHNGETLLERYLTGESMSIPRSKFLSTFTCG
jgi:hypothetical protein